MVERGINRIVWPKAWWIFLACVAGAVVALPAATQADALTAAHQEQIESVLDAVRGPSGVTRVLSSLGFGPGAEGVTGKPLEGLKNWPDARKLESAFHMAEAAKTGSGETLLKDAMVTLARSNHAITADEAFRRHIVNDSTYVETPGKFTLDDAKRFKPRTYTFKAVTAAKLAEPLPAEFRAVVETISAHGSHHGKVVRLTRICCKISPKEVYERLRKSPSYRSVYEWALTKAPPPPSIETKVNRLVLGTLSNR